MGALNDNFISKLQSLETILALRDAHLDDTAVSELLSVQKLINRTGIDLKVMKQKQEEQRSDLATLQGHIKSLASLKEKLIHMTNNMPARLPKQLKQAPVERKSKKPIQETSLDQSSASSLNASATSKSSKGASAMSAPSAKQNTIYYPEVEFLTVDEFNLVPKYLKGRFTYDRVNKVIEGMNAAFEAKYKLLWAKKTTMSDANRKKYEDYNRQITKDTKGCYFITDDDLKEYGSMKIDSAARSILTILRHCGRIREVHGGKLTRYVYLEHY